MERLQNAQRICIEVLFFNGMIESPFRDYILNIAEKLLIILTMSLVVRKRKHWQDCQTVSEFI